MKKYPLAVVGLCLLAVTSALWASSAPAAGQGISPTPTPSSTAPATEAAQGKLAADATRYVDQLAAGDFTAAESTFGPQMKAGLPPERLASIWQGLVAQYGAFRRVSATEVSKAGQFDQVLVTCEMANGTLGLSVTYNSSGEIAGFHLAQASPGGGSASAGLPSRALLATTAIVGLFCFAYPIVAGAITHKRTGGRWRSFAIGMLILTLFQLATRIQLLKLVQPYVTSLVTSPLLIIAWLFILSLTAGLFEEVGRYVAFRWLFAPGDRTWGNGLMYGFGHGGMEAVFLVGVPYLALAFQASGPFVFIQTVASGQAAAALQTFRQYAQSPAWAPLIAGYERLWAVALQVGLSILVLQVFRRHSLRWLWLAIGVHTLVDFLVGVLPTLIPMPPASKVIIGEGIVSLFGLAALWWIWRLREPYRGD